VFARKLKKLRKKMVALPPLNNPEAKADATELLMLLEPLPEAELVEFPLLEVLHLCWLFHP
jgi:hypothetical protein